ncbi:MAG: ATP-binding protein [Candidatus Phocaeicola faecigallinarum]|uniref:ATP-binding protein n=1 Tax=Candidatus Phocaeicola faecigallinarum TaxID=2838732 RepID=A0A948T9N8_9BACT|nr:ATP-binding protein [Candidatus Phocaeicola faecigallinarum]
MTSLRFQPITGKAEDIVAVILQTEEVVSCPDIQYPIHLVCEEIVINIVNYAYPDNDNGYLKVEVTKNENDLVIRFIDSGIPFDPLQKEVPDISLPLEKRQIGGLGIFLVQQMMDMVSYEYSNNENILTIKKNIGHEK